jgi:hypothetical protein
VVYDQSTVCNTSLGVPSNCGDMRGGLFSNVSSSTWEDEGEFTLGLNTPLGYNGIGEYGMPLKHRESDEANLWGRI